MFPWFIFPLFGWGIDIAAHYIEAFRWKTYTEQLAEREYQRLKKSKKKELFSGKSVLYIAVG